MPAIIYAEMRKFRESEILGMIETLVVSSRGQVTLPAALRKRLGISPGDVLIVGDRNGELVFKPAAVFEIERFTDEQIAEWDREDAMGVDQQARIDACLAASTNS